MQRVTLIEYLTATRLLSWSDRKSHLQRLQQIIPDFRVTDYQKIYLAGYAEATEQVLAKVIHFVQTGRVCGLKHLFNSLPYGEDELGLTVMGDMLSVYLLLHQSGDTVLCVVDSANQQVRFLGEVSGFPYYRLRGKRIVYPPLSLLPTPPE